MPTPLRHQLALGLLVFGLALILPGRVEIWVDESGRTTLTNRGEPSGLGAIRLSPEDLALRWRGQLLGEPVAERADSSDDQDRFTRELLASRDDIRRGELKRGLKRLRRLHNAHPRRPEPAWLLAQVERHRGRLEPARDALDAALGLAASMPEEWRAAALALREEIEAELAHAERADHDGAPLRVQEAPHFRISYDHHFAGREFGARTLGLLERVREFVGTSLGRALDRPLDVRLYTRAQYLEAYRHRFGFATVGFYDGAIHVVSGRHPRRELFALLVHEYAHAVFEEALEGHQPFFLNEGIADREEERARGRTRLSRGEWRQLLEALRAGSWIRLGSLVRGFGGLEGKRALLAYLEARAAVELIESRQPGATARWLARCAAGTAWQAALLEETGLDTLGLEGALVEDVRSRFPADPLAGLDLAPEFSPELSPPEPSSQSRRDSPSDTPGGGPRAASRSDARARA